MSQQSRQELPDSDDPLVREDRKVAFGWLQFFRSLYVKTGGGNSSDNTAAYLQIEPDDSLGVYRAADGIKLGTLTVTP